MTPCSVILCRVGLRAVSHCAASGNWNVRKIQNCLTLRSQTPCSFSTASSQTIFLFSKTSISMSFRIYVKIFRKKFEKISKIQKWLTLRAVWYCAESESAQYGTARSQLLKFTADPKVSNIARSQTPRSVILGRVWLCAVSHCSEFCREQFCLASKENIKKI